MRAPFKFFTFPASHSRLVGMAFITRNLLLFLVSFLLLLPLVSLSPYHDQVLHDTLLGQCGALAHVHIAKTGGSTFNKEAAFRYERVCGNKGNSAEHVPQNIHRVIKPIKKEHHLPIFDCDLISLEVSWRTWAARGAALSAGPLNCSLVALIPCRDPFEHMLSQCNHKGKKIHESSIETPEQLYEKCRGWEDRFSFQMFNTTPPIFARDFCYHFETMNQTLENLKSIIIPRIRPLEEHRDYLIEQKTSEKPRKKTPTWLEALHEKFNVWAVENVPYYKYCSSCPDFDQWIQTELAATTTTTTTKKKKKKKK